MPEWLQVTVFKSKTEAWTLFYRKVIWTKKEWSIVDCRETNDRWWLLVNAVEFSLLCVYCKRIVQILQKENFAWTVKKGDWQSWEQQSCQMMQVHELVGGFQWLPQIHRVARFCRASKRWISPELCGFHTVAAYSKVGRTDNSLASSIFRCATTNKHWLTQTIQGSGAFTYYKLTMLWPT